MSSEEQDGYKFIVICAQMVGSGPFSTEYNWDGKKFTRYSDAVSHGFEIRGSDDFNIAGIRNGRITELMWMSERFDNDEGTLMKISRQIGLGHDRWRDETETKDEIRRERAALRTRLQEAEAERDGLQASLTEYHKEGRS